MKLWDVLGIGCAAVDDLLFVDEFPRPDVKVRVQHAERQGGGLTATALVAAARLGASCAYGGQLGFDEYSNFTANALEAEGINLEPATRRAEAAPFHSTIIVDTLHNTRNIFFQKLGEVGPAPDAPAKSHLERARVLFLDHYGGKSNVAAVHTARELGIPIVADIERDNVPEFDAFFPLIDHLVLSQNFARKYTGATESEAILRALWNEHRKVIVLTLGEAGCWTLEAEQIHHYKAFETNVVDTTGCGDVFHGVYAATLAWNWPLPRRIQYASAAAAIKAATPGAQRGIPTLHQIETFINTTK